MKRKQNTKESKGPLIIDETKVGKIKASQTFETKSISEEPPYIFPSTIQIWCIPCEKNWIVSKKNDDGTFKEQQICPHSILKRVKK